MKEVNHMCLKSDLAHFVASRLLFDSSFAIMVREAVEELQGDLDEYFDKIVNAQSDPVPPQQLLGYNPEDQEIYSQYDPRRRF